MTMDTSNQPSFSLLWPHGRQPTATDVTITPQTARDIGLQAVIERMSGTNEQRQAIEAIFYHLPSDPDVIRYRQAILADLLQQPALLAQFQQLMPTIEALTYHHFRRDVRESTDLYEVTWRLGELEGIVTCVQGVNETLTAVADQIHADGLHALHREAQQIAADPVFQDLVHQLPALLDKVRANQSVTIGVNLDNNLLPEEAVLLAVNDRRFTEAGFLGKLLDRAGAKWRGIAPLHTAEPPEPSMMIGTPVPLAMSSKPDPMMAQLFRDLAQVLNKVARPIADALKTYAQISGALFVGLWRELTFYLTAVQLIQRIQACGLPVCRPQIVPMAERVCCVTDNTNLNLILNLSLGSAPVDLRRQVVANDVTIGENGRVQILTGPNQGGKTTYVQAVGLTQVLAQAGLHVPGTEARISPVDGIFTHFPIEEKFAGGSGRFGDEAQRLNEIFKQATRHSLILLNESLTSTSAGESLYLAQDLVRVMRKMGTRAIFATHMHELAASVETVNEDTDGGSRVVSLVASRVVADGHPDAGAVTRSYRIEPGPPMGRSFARELAGRYGIRYEQLVASLQARGVLPEEE